ncbi:MAG TPA: hypothetical protein VI997_00515 [Candidatus Thermoplasmatota archaeon]|nr:hypothetical protein [Candidatus Thermoplasmatota archaeon]
MASSIAFSLPQTTILLAAWFVVAVFPAFLVRRATVRDENPAAPAWFWVVLLTGPVGVAAWWMDRRIRARRRAKGMPMPE